MNIRYPHRTVRDDYGSEFPTPEDARTEAFVTARQAMAIPLEPGNLLNDGRYEITNENGAVVCVVPFREAASSSVLAPSH